MQTMGIFQAYAGSNGPDQPANIGNPIKAYLRPFKQCKVDQSADATLYRLDNAGVHVKTEPLLFEYDDKFSNGAAQIKKY